MEWLIVREAEPEMSLKDRNKWVVDCLAGAATFGIPSGLLALAASLSAYEFVAVLVGGGLFPILILRRLFNLDRTLDDPERIAAIRPLIVQEQERELS